MGTTDQIGLSLEYKESLAKLFTKNEFPSDFCCIAEARRTGFDEEDIWRDVCEIVRMRDDEGYYAKVGQLRAMAKRLRK